MNSFSKCMYKKHTSHISECWENYFVPAECQAIIYPNPDVEKRLIQKQLDFCKKLKEALKVQLSKIETAEAEEYFDSLDYVFFACVCKYVCFFIMILLLTNYFLVSYYTFILIRLLHILMGTLF